MRGFRFSYANSESGLSLPARRARGNFHLVGRCWRGRAVAPSGLFSNSGADARKGGTTRSGDRASAQIREKEFLLAGARLFTLSRPKYQRESSWQRSPGRSPSQQMPRQCEGRASLTSASASSRHPSRSGRFRHWLFQTCFARTLRCTEERFCISSAGSIIGGGNQMLK